MNNPSLSTYTKYWKHIPDTESRYQILRTYTKHLKHIPDTESRYQILGTDAKYPSHRACIPIYPSQLNQPCKCTAHHVHTVHHCFSHKKHTAGYKFCKMPCIFCNLWSNTEFCTPIFKWYCVDLHKWQSAQPIGSYHRELPFHIQYSISAPICIIVS